MPEREDSEAFNHITLNIMKQLEQNNFGNRVLDVRSKDHLLIDIYFKLSQMMDKVSSILELIDGVIWDLGASVTKV